MDGLLDLTTADDARRAHARRAVVGYVAAGGVWTAGVLVMTGLAPVPPSTIALVGVASFLVASAVLLWRMVRPPRTTPVADLALVDTPTAVADDDETARLRSMFLRAVSHELRTPVTNMIGCAETIRRHHEALTPRQVEELAERLVANGRRLERHVVDLLELREPDTTAASSTGRVVDVGALLADLVDEHADGPHVLQARSSVRRVVIDDRAVRRIVGELIDNVRRHTPPGTTATLTAVRHRDDILIVVEDDGPGLDPLVAATVAEPFVQGRHVAAHARPGLGIGLALAARYAELNGGRLELSCSPHGGTRATVMLPAVAVTSDAA